MSENEVQNWILSQLHLLKMDAKHLNRLSSTDLLYLYVQVFIKYKVKISVQEINHGCFSSVETLASTIVRSISNNEGKEMIMK